MKKQQTKLEDLITDQYFSFLTSFQRAFIKEVIYFIKTKGEHCLYKKYTEQKYAEFIKPEQMYLEIDDLVKRRFLFEGKKTKKFNDSFYVVNTYTVNEEGIRYYVNELNTNLTIDEKIKKIEELIKVCIEQERYESAAHGQKLIEELRQQKHRI